MRRTGRDRPIAARDLVLALRAGLDALVAVPNGEFDRLIIAELEMQEGPMLERAPVAAVERVVAEKLIAPATRRPPRRAITSRMRSAIAAPMRSKKARVR